MTCVACQHTNLPGGIRCIYCGVPFPSVADFDLEGEQTASPTKEVILDTDQGAASGKSAKGTGAVGLLAVLALKGKTLLGLLKFGKIATTLFSMLAFIAADAALFGWKFGVGIAVSIFIHEMGHVVVNWRKGLKQSAPMFIPFLGAVIFVKGFPDDPTIQSESGAGGPAAGMLAALACLAIGLITKNPFWLALANIGFAINLFNLIPFPPLDGSHISTVFSPKIWDSVLITMLLFALKVPAPMLWMVLIVGFVFRLGRSHDVRHLLAAPSVRIRMAIIYLVLALGLSFGAQSTQENRSLIYGKSAKTSVQPSTQVSQNTDEENQVSPPPRSLEGTATAKQDREDARAGLALIAFVGKVILSLTACLLWIIANALLIKAAGLRWKARYFALSAALLAILPLLWGGIWVSDRLAQQGWSLLGAYGAAALGAVFYAGHQAYHQQERKLKLFYMPLVARCMAWAAGAALLVAYMTTGVEVIIGVALCALLWYLRFPWMLVSWAGSLAEQMGDWERSLALRQRALALRPDRESVLALQTSLANLNIQMGRGEAALTALDAKQKLQMEGLPVGTPPRLTLQDLELRTGALVLLEKYDEALLCCEQILKIPVDATQGNILLLAIHLRLARLAYFRGWADESLAQAEWCLGVLPQTAKTLLATVHGLRAEALLALDRTEEARTASELSLKASRENQVEARAANFRAQLCLHTNDPAGAEKETRRASHLLAGHLGNWYWRGKALLATGQTEQGTTLLRELAQKYPNDHWGKLADNFDTAGDP